MASTTYTTSAPFIADGMTITTGGVGGLSLAAMDASGSVKIYAGGALATTIASTGAATFSSSVNLGSIANSGDISLLNIKQSSTSYNNGIYLERGGERNGYFMYIGGGSDALTFRRNYFGTQSDVMSLTRDANVGIGTTAPESTLVVQKNVAGGRGGELSIVNYASPTVGNESALNFGTEASTYGNNDNNFQIKAYLNNINGATDAIFSNWSGSAFSERMRISSSGNVGINTPSPVGLLNIYGGDANAAAIFTIQSVSGGSGNSGIYFRPYQSAAIANANPAQAAILAVDDNYSASIQFWTKTGGAAANALVERMRITSGGNVLIGTATDNGCRLQAVGSGTVASFNDTSSGDVTITLLANGTFRGGLGADANYALKITGVGGTQVAVINASTGAYTATSDRTLKKNISDSPLALPVLNQIKIRQYNWKSDDSVEQYGVIAQELYEVAPVYVSKPKKETDKWGVSKAELVPLLIKAIQEQQSQIEELKALIK